MQIACGDVVLIPFPFRDRLAEKTRPAVVVSSDLYNNQGDLVFAAITSQTSRLPTDYELMDWQHAGLQYPSTVRMLLASIASSRVILNIGRLSDRDCSQVVARLHLVFPYSDNSQLTTAN